MTKNQELVKERKRNERLLAMVKAEREKVSGYEQLAKVHSAYIAILLQKLGATKDRAVAIRAEEVKRAMQCCETRALSADDGSWSLYCEEVGEK